MADEEKPQEFTVKYIKSNFFRVIAAEGVFGGLSPQGKIHMSVWSERKPIPKYSTYKFDHESSNVDELMERRDEDKADFVREVDVDVVLDISLAKTLVEWLQSKIKVAEDTKIKVKDSKNE